MKNWSFPLGLLNVLLDIHTGEISVYNYYCLDPNSILQGICGIVLTVTVFPQMQLLCKLGKLVLNFIQKFTKT